VRDVVTITSGGQYSLCEVQRELTSRIHGERLESFRSKPLGQAKGEQNIRSLRLPIGSPFVVFLPVLLDFSMQSMPLNISQSGLTLKFTSSTFRLALL
jgi:hypothetical protein